jgi:hypothetical protein
LTTSTTPRVQVPRHVAWLVTWLVASLVVDYIDYAARLGASACCAARHAARRAARHRLLRLAQARHRLLRLRRASRCLGSSRCSFSATSNTPRVQLPWHVTRLVVDYFASASRPGASARHAAHHEARRRLLRLRRAFRCLGISRGSSRSSSRRSSPTTSHKSCVQVPRHVARLIMQLVVDYFTYVARPVASAHHAASRMTHR